MYYGYYGYPDGYNITSDLSVKFHPKNYRGQSVRVDFLYINNGTDKEKQSVENLKY